MSRQIDLVLPTLHPLQVEIKKDPARFKVACLGRRSGKSFLIVDLTAHEMLKAGHHVGIFAPTYKLLDELWREIIRTLFPIIKSKDSQQKHMEFITGSTLDCWTLENPDAGRGRRYHLVLIDEAAMARNLQEAWQQAIRPTLMDFNGRACFMSTPKGKNFFFTLFSQCQDESEPDWKSWQMPTSCNPYIAQSEIETSRKELPELVYKQEIEAEFIDDGGLVFKFVNECIASGPVESSPNGQDCYVAGVDWGKHNDFTVICVFNATQRHMVEFMRFNQIDYLFQSKKVRELVNKWKCKDIWVELNSIGEPIYEKLKHDYNLPVTGFHTTNASKAEAVEALALAFQNLDITILSESVLKQELEIFGIERLPSGNWRYAAPEGFHDDCVISLMLAWQAVIHTPSSVSADPIVMDSWI